jgi:hypothetical protein
MTTPVREVLGALTMLGLLAPAASGQTAPASAPHDVTALAKETQNPVGNVISVPFQFNFNNGGGLEDQTLFTLNVQPVIPFKLTDRWNLISRTIIPINSAPGPHGSRYSGVGDINQQLFFTPAKPGAIIWGAGPVLSLPTSTAVPTTTGTWGAGVGAVVVKMTGPFVLGGLVTQVWPMVDAGGEPEVNLFTLQPFLNFNFGAGYALGFAPVMTANWDGEPGERWTVPLGIGISRTTVFNGRPITLAAQYYHNITRPDAGPGNQLRLVMTLLFPPARRAR